MRLSIPLEELQVGEDLGADIFDQQGQLLLRKGTVLFEDLIEALKGKGITTVYILEDEDEMVREIPDTPPPTVVMDKSVGDHGGQQKFFNLYKEMLWQMRRTALRGNYIKIMQEELIEYTLDLMKTVLNRGQVHELQYYFNIKSANREHQYEVHAVNTGILSGVIGHWLDLGMHTILELALTGCLHDIGKTRIPAHILNKKGRLTQTEWKIVKEHPVIGAAILYKTKWIMPSVIMGVLRHHERLDGSGYPGKCLGSEIPLYARIVAVAEAFDTVTSIRPYARAMTTFEAVAHLRDQSFGQLDAMITRTLYDKVLEYYMGKPVQLSNGDTGVIIYLDQKLPRPVIKTDKGFYDLSKQGAPSITRIL